MTQPAVALVIPVLDEESTLPALVETLGALDPAPAEIVVVDGGSGDASVALARDAGWTVIETTVGRARQINRGVEAARAPLVCVLHADSIPPRDMVQVIRDTLADDRIALASFTPRIAGPGGTRWGTTLHNWVKTWYAPLITRPHLFVRGVRLLFGDHGMFFRREQFLALGGCTPGDIVMEEADLCVKFADAGPHPHGAALDRHVGPPDCGVGTAESQLDLFQGRHPVGRRRAQPDGARLSACALEARHCE